jgi:PAS domain S-box-containing protein
MFTNKTLDPGLMRVSLERQALSIFADNSSQFIFWKDRDSVYQGCNDNFANYAGIADKAQIVGRTDYDLPWSKEEADFFRKIDKAVMDSGEAKLNYEEYQTLSDGKIRWLQISKSPLFDSRGKVYGIVGWYSDITSIKEMQTQINEHTKSMVEYNIRLEDTNKALELANLDLEKFTAAASHDLKSPIRSVMSFAQLLHAKKKDEFDEESMEYLDFIINYAKRMDTLVHDILTYAKSGAKNLKSSHIVLSKLVGHKLLDLQDVINTRSVKVTINLPTKSIACYPELLGMVFYNLVSNGIKFNKSDQPCITID